MQHAAGTGRREVQLEVAGGVPGERRHPAVGGDLQVIQHAAKPACALGPVAVGDPFAPGRRRRRHRLVREVLLGPVEEVRDGQRDVLHRALHAARVPAGPQVASCRGSDPQRRRGRASGQRGRSGGCRRGGCCRRASPALAPVVGAADPRRLRRVDHLHERRQRGVGELGQQQARGSPAAFVAPALPRPRGGRRHLAVDVRRHRHGPHRCRVHRLPPDRPGLPRDRTVVVHPLPRLHAGGTRRLQPQLLQGRDRA